MSMSTHVVGIRPPDANWLKHKKVWDACEAAGVAIPRATMDFFDGVEPDDAGVLLDDDKLNDAVTEWKDEYRSGFEVEIEKLPAGVKRLRFYNSW